jgi:hypothetical protein
MFHARFPTLERVFWKESLTRGDIVSFAFPIENPRPWDIVKPRPCRAPASSSTSRGMTGAERQ